MGCTHAGLTSGGVICLRDCEAKKTPAEVAYSPLSGGVARWQRRDIASTRRGQPLGDTTRSLAGVHIHRSHGRSRDNPERDNRDD